MKTTLSALRKFISDYLYFEDASILLPICYWIAGTYLFESFDAFPYCVITASTKRSGKTLLSELMAFCSNVPFRVTGATAQALFRAIEDRKPTIIWDEAETLSSEASSVLRAFLNVGYRKGQTVPRASGESIKEWPTYCPKVFVLIGQVFDTLRDRSIVVNMRRGTTQETDKLKRFSHETCKTRGLEFVDEIRSLIAENYQAILDVYENDSLEFLTDRDEEIWRPVFAICKVLEPENYVSMKRIAVDMAAEKTAPVKDKELLALEEKRAQKEEYAIRLVKDMLTITKTVKAISSSDAVEALRKIDVAPWRKILGTGLDMLLLADLLAVFELRPKVHRAKGNAKNSGSGQGVFRGYSRDQILDAAKKARIL